ncbi:MAG: hypothetical protein IMZ69_05235 [Spirochaetes bacterium]|nr:hypothetical protein [Spirochaetota bacterium]
MADLTPAIARTLKRLTVGGRVLDGVTWFPKLYEGLSKEFGRVDDYRKKVLAAAIPNENLPTESLDDQEAKYGIENYLGFTDQERVDRIMERANRDGNGGADWLQEQVQQAGFTLYVISNGKQPTSSMQYGGDIQYAETVQYGISVSRINPATVLGELICSSPPAKAGRRYLTQYGLMQYGGSSLYGTANPAFSYPQPRRFLIPSDPLQWGRFFFLSPFADRLAINDGELLELSAEEFRYLRRLIIQTKYLRDWCVAQVKIV